MLRDISQSFLIQCVAGFILAVTAFHTVPTPFLWSIPLGHKGKLLKSFFLLFSLAYTPNVGPVGCNNKTDDHCAKLFGWGDTKGRVSGIFVKKDAI